MIAPLSINSSPTQTADLSALFSLSRQGRVECQSEVGALLTNYGKSRVDNDYESMSPWRAECFAAVVRVSQGLVQVRIVKNVPEPIDRFAMRPRVIAEHALDLSQRKRENCVAAALQRRSYRLGTDEFAET
jgi:hypothetical protein